MCIVDLKIADYSGILSDLCRYLFSANLLHNIIINYKIIFKANSRLKQLNDNSNSHLSYKSSEKYPNKCHISEINKYWPKNFNDSSDCNYRIHKHHFLRLLKF